MMRTLVRYVGGISPWKSATMNETAKAKDCKHANLHVEMEAGLERGRASLCGEIRV